MKVPPVVAEPSPEGAVFALSLLQARRIFLSAIVSGFLLGYRPLGLAKYSA